METKFEIEFIDENSNLIESIESPCNPYKLDDIIYLNIHVHNEGFWDKNTSSNKFQVIEIIHFVRVDYYGDNFKDAKCKTIMTVSVKIKKIW